MIELILYLGFKIDFSKTIVSLSSIMLPITIPPLIPNAYSLLEVNWTTVLIFSVSSLLSYIFDSSKLLLTLFMI